jgi:hypothetical protein
MVGVAFLSSFGTAQREGAFGDEPQTPRRAAATVAAATGDRFLLLTNGRFVPGAVTEEGSDYLVTQRVGTMRFPKKTVEGVFGSIRDAYQYKLEQLPELDSDERMKLARWCLEQRLTVEAKEQLTEILRLNPSNGPARTMLVKIDQEEARSAFRMRDPEVQQTRADRMTDERERLAVLDSAVIGRAQSVMGITSTPVIFDLPKPLAIKRAGEFFQFVHPVLQAHCAKCHNGQYDGPFQLVPIKTRVDRTPDALRHNLDATLALIDRDNPSRSDLLTSTLRAHGRGPNPRPIYPGSNDRYYQVLAAWASGLRAPRTEAGGSRALAVQSETEQSVPFAADRTRVGPAAPGLPPTSASGDTALQPPARFAPNLGVVIPDQDPGNPKEFPIPFAISGAKPPLPSANDALKGRAQATQSPRAKTSPTGPASAGSAASHPDAARKPASRPATSKSSEQDEAEKDPAAPKKPAKPVKINPSVLEQLLRNRNQSRQAQP